MWPACLPHTRAHLLTTACITPPSPDQSWLAQDGGSWLTCWQCWPSACISDWFFSTVKWVANPTLPAHRADGMERGERQAPLRCPAERSIGHRCTGHGEVISVCSRQAHTGASWDTGKRHLTKSLPPGNAPATAPVFLPTADPLSQLSPRNGHVAS